MISEFSKGLVYFAVMVFLFVTSHIYFRIAEKAGIIDIPNQRSSHKQSTIRGGGIIFALTLIIWFLQSSFLYPWFLIGTVLVSVVSFVDDVSPQPALLRFIVQVIAFSLLGVQVNLFVYPWWVIGISYTLAVGALNAFNFMDGINGITGLYAFVNLGCLYIIDHVVTDFIQEELIIFVILSILVFLFFNFRKRARCFAGDIGSVTLAFIQAFIIIKLILHTGNLGWILLVLIFGIDSVVTIAIRIRNREDIFSPHRSHLYQYLSNEYNMPHLWVSAIYAFVQLGINILLILFMSDTAYGFPLLVLLIFGLLYLIIRNAIIKSHLKLH